MRIQNLLILALMSIAMLGLFVADVEAIEKVTISYPTAGTAWRGATATLNYTVFIDPALQNITNISLYDGTDRIYINNTLMSSSANITQAINTPLFDDGDSKTMTLETRNTTGIVNSTTVSVTMNNDAPTLTTPSTSTPKKNGDTITTTVDSQTDSCTIQFTPSGNSYAMTLSASVCTFSVGVDVPPHGGYTSTKITATDELTSTSVSNLNFQFLNDPNANQGGTGSIAITQAVKQKQQKDNTIVIVIIIAAAALLLMNKKK